MQLLWGLFIARNKMIEQILNCAYCPSREYHCFFYVDACASDLIHFRMPCPIYSLRLQIEAKREFKRLHLDSPEEMSHGLNKIDKIIPAGSNPLDYYSQDESIRENSKEPPNNSLHHLDTHIQSGDDGGW